MKKEVERPLVERKKRERRQIKRGLKRDVKAVNVVRGKTRRTRNPRVATQPVGLEKKPKTKLIGPKRKPRQLVGDDAFEAEVIGHRKQGRWNQRFIK